MVDPYVRSYFENDDTGKFLLDAAEEQVERVKQTFGFNGDPYITVYQSYGGMLYDYPSNSIFISTATFRGFSHYSLSELQENTPLRRLSIDTEEYSVPMMDYFRAGIREETAHWAQFNRLFEWSVIAGETDFNSYIQNYAKLFQYSKTLTACLDMEVQARDMADAAAAQYGERETYQILSKILRRNHPDKYYRSMSELLEKIK